MYFSIDVISETHFKFKSSPAISQPVTETVDREIGMLCDEGWVPSKANLSEESRNEWN